MDSVEYEIKSKNHNGITIKVTDDSLPEGKQVFGQRITATYINDFETATEAVETVVREMVQEQRDALNPEGRTEGPFPDLPDQASVDLPDAADR